MILRNSDEKVLRVEAKKFRFDNVFIFSRNCFDKIRSTISDPISKVYLKKFLFWLYNNFFWCFIYARFLETGFPKGSSFVIVDIKLPLLSLLVSHIGLSNYVFCPVTHTAWLWVIFLMGLLIIKGIFFVACSRLVKFSPKIRYWRRITQIGLFHFEKRTRSLQSLFSHI